jgi:hypothetical protein
MAALANAHGGTQMRTATQTRIRAVMAACRVPVADRPSVCVDTGRLSPPTSQLRTARPQVRVANADAGLRLAACIRVSQTRGGAQRQSDSPSRSCVSQMQGGAQPWRRRCSDKCLFRQHSLTGAKIDEGRMIVVGNDRFHLDGNWCR